MSSMFGILNRARTVKTLGAISAAALLFAGLAAGSAQAATITFESDGFILAVPGEEIGFSDLPLAVAEGLLPALPQLPAGAGAAMDGVGPYEVIGGLRYDIDVDDPDTSQVRSWLLDIRLAGTLAIFVDEVVSSHLSGLEIIPFEFEEMDIPVGDFSTDQAAAFFAPSSPNPIGAFIGQALVDCGAGPHDFGGGNCLFVPDGGLLNGDLLFGLSPGTLDGFFFDLIGGEALEYAQMEGDLVAVSVAFEADAKLKEIVDDVPAPTTLLLFGAALAGLGLYRRRRRQIA